MVRLMSCGHYNRAHKYVCIEMDSFRADHAKYAVHHCCPLHPMTTRHFSANGAYSPTNGVPAEVDFLQRLRRGNSIRNWADRLTDQLARYYRKLSMFRA